MERLFVFCAVSNLFRLTYRALSDRILIDDIIHPFHLSHQFRRIIAISIAGKIFKYAPFIIPFIYKRIMHIAVVMVVLQ